MTVAFSQMNVAAVSIPRSDLSNIKPSLSAFLLVGAR